MTPGRSPEEVRARVLAAVSRGEITQRRSRIRWSTDGEGYRSITVPERRQLLALLSERVIRFVNGDPQRHGIGHYEIADQHGTQGEPRHGFSRYQITDDTDPDRNDDGTNA